MHVNKNIFSFQEEHTYRIRRHNAGYHNIPGLAGGFFERYTMGVVCTEYFWKKNTVKNQETINIFGIKLRIWLKRPCEKVCILSKYLDAKIFSESF